MSDELEDYPICVTRAISWGQMDAFQHVNNAHYFRFFEDARIAYFEAIGIYDVDEHQPNDHIGPILAETSCRFKAPLTYPDDVVIGARAADIQQDRFTLEYAVWSASLDRIAATGDSLVVSYDYAEGHKVDLPDDWRSAIEDLG